MKEKLQRFMAGRYGMDDLSRFTLYAMLGLCVISLFVREPLLNIVLLLGLVLIYFRMFSKNHQQRYQENQKFMQLKGKFLGVLRRNKNIATQKKDFRIYSCPSCHQKIRIPKGKGKIEVTCPKCQTSFIKKS